MCAYAMKSFYYRAKLVSLALVLLTLFAAGPAFSGTWRVLPIRLDFDQRLRSGVITVTNDSDENIAFSVNARLWTQSSEGQAIYEETSDLLFFPQHLIIEPHQERVIRVGIKVPAIDREKTYRLFITQETAPEKQQGTNVAIAIRFGVPIFSKPLKEIISGKIIRADLENGAVRIGIRNTGNIHMRVNRIQLTGHDADGNEIFNQSLNGGYLLAGTERQFSDSIPASVCTQVKTVDIQVTSNENTLNGKIDVDQARCLNP